MYLYSGTILTFKRCIVLLHTLSAYNSLLVRYKVTRLVPGNVCIQAEGMLKPMKTLVLTSTISKESYENKNTIVILNCQPLLLGENCTEIRVWQLKFTNNYTPSWLSCLLFNFVLLIEPASDCRKTNKGWGFIEKVVETKLMQY